MKKLLLACLLLTVSGWLSAQQKVLETDWLQPSVGSEGTVLGAEVKRIAQLPDDKGFVIDLAIPLENASRFDEIEVISNDTDSPLPQLKTHRWIEDYEKDDYGLRIFLKRNPRVGFRLRLIDMDSDKQR